MLGHRTETLWQPHRLPRVTASCLAPDPHHKTPPQSLTMQDCIEFPWRDSYHLWRSTVYSVKDQSGRCAWQRERPPDPLPVSCNLACLVAQTLRTPSAATTKWQQREHSHLHLVICGRTAELDKTESLCKQSNKSAFVKCQVRNTGIPDIASLR